MRSLETLAVNIQNTKAEIRLEVVGSSRKPSLVAVKKEKAALSDDVPFDDVRLVVNASGGYQLFVYRSVQNADCRLQPADCRLQTGYKMQTRYKMQTADCRPGTKCRPSLNK